MRYTRAMGVFVGGFVVQWLWSTYFPVFGLAPQVLLIMTMAVSSQSGPVIGQCYGFAWGLLLDVLSTHAFGANALVLTLVGYSIGVLRRQMDVSGSSSQVMLVALLTPLYFLSTGLTGLVFEHEFLWPGWGSFIINPFYNCLIAPLGFAVARRFVAFDSWR